MWKWQEAVHEAQAQTSPRISKTPQARRELSELWAVIAGAGDWFLKVVDDTFAMLAQNSRLGRQRTSPTL